ncbi:ABC transporter ATP-binding protein [Roseateles sp.]|uniref:ABC transporter ATP-binding protein n=1 Tax=Roseateles sp. TaxID=1971397 RepID=UPI003BAB09D5
MNRGEAVDTTPVLAFSGVEVRAGKIALLSDLNLQLPRCGLFGLVGPNGAGKSTLVRAALGLQATSRGEVRLRGRRLQDWRPRELAQQVGYVPQHIHSHWDLTVRELLQLSLAPPTAELLQDFELEPLLARRFNTLSGGEQARAAIARAMAHEPALLLADEPAAHLDLPHQHALLRLLQACAARAAVVIVLHDLHLAARYCDQVAVLSQGRLLHHGPPDAALDGASLAQAYQAPVQRVSSTGQSFFTVPMLETPP